ncbi:unnamed protein product [Mytilus edulis]|uniref:Ig-like domain-containing protein n=1 Tax=Mytilus edulis TaxID=6550 RepID=A0A8S3QPE0_MYTED|nr:unnamed protein product [Mytilus edulis]
MSSILTLMIMIVYMEIIPGILNDIVTVRVTKGERVVLKCCGSGDVRTWLGPDINNATTGNEVYFLNNDKNPKLNQSNHILQINDRNYDLIILNFQNENTGFYVCRFLNNGGFHETKFNVSLKDTSLSIFSKIVHDDKERDSVLNATHDWKTNATQIIEVLREVQYDEIGIINYNVVNIETLRDDTRDRMTVMHLSGINIDILSSKSPTLSYSSTNDSLSRKTEGSDNTYESINLNQNHEFKNVKLVPQL